MRLKRWLTLLLMVTLGLAHTTLGAAATHPSHHAVSPPPATGHLGGAEDPLADLGWQWGDISLAPGSRGILVADWDADGHNEVLTAHGSLIIVLRHAANYRFEQEWAGPVGPGWGLADLNGDDDLELWILNGDGRLVSYAPHSHNPTVLGDLGDTDGVQVTGALMADLLQDGQQELLVLLQSGSTWHLRTYDLPSLSQTWAYTLDYTGDVWGGPGLAVGQVDDDRAMEIIVGFGAVVDRALSVEQWFYNEGFGIEMGTADVDADGRDEIVGMSGWYRITAFDVDLRTPKWQIETGSDHDSLYLADVAGDPTPEILVGEGQWGEVKVYDAQNQQLLWGVDNPEHGVSGIGVGDANDDGELDLIWGAGWTSSGADHLYLTPISRRSYTFASPDYDGPYRVVAMQMDEDDPLELVVFTASSDSGYGGPTHFILDSASGAEEPGLELAIDAGAYNTSLSANVDGDPYQELVLSTGNDLYTLDHDGSPLTRHSFSASLTPVWVGDADSDGQLELVSTTGDRINTHRLDTLEYEWQSVRFGQGVRDAAVGDIDQDGHMEIVFHGPNSYLQAYDGVTHLLEWQMASTQRVSAVAIGNADAAGSLEIAVVECGRLTFYDGLTRELITQTVHIAEGYYGTTDLAFAHMTSSPHPQLVAASGEGVFLFQHPYDELPAQTLGLASAAVALCDTDNDHHMDVLVGHGLGIARYRLREPFPDIVPPAARAQTPAAGADLVSRNAFAEAGFNEDINLLTINETTAQLQAAGSPIPVDLSYDAATRVVRLSPQSLLPADSTITVWLGPGLQDLAGNGLDGNLNGVGGEPDDAFSWQFSTGSGVDRTGPVVHELVLAPNPAWAGMPVRLSADIDDTDPSAASTVRRAEYWLDELGTPGTGAPLAAVDGGWDERQEHGHATLDTTGWSGDHFVYVQAEDSVGNWGAPAMMTLTLESELPANWPTFGQNPAHTGYNAAQTGVTGYTLAWERDLNGLFGVSGPALQQVAIANGIVVANVDSRTSGGVIALDVEDGNELWRCTFVGKFSVNPASIAYGNVYFQQCNHGSDTYLFALNAVTGEEVWRAPFGAQWEAYYAPAVADGKVFINGGAYGGIYAFDAFDGDQLWFAGLPQYDQWTPAHSQGVVYSYVEGVLKAWDPEYGTELWSLALGWDWEGWSMDRMAVVSGDAAYVTNSSGYRAGDLVAVDLATHTEKWRVPGAFAGTPAAADDQVFALDGTVLRVYDADTGDELWSYTADETLHGAPLVTAGNVYVASADHTWVLDRSTGALVWEQDQGGWLAVANDQLFIAQPNGELAAYSKGVYHAVFLPVVIKQAAG